MEFIFSQRLSEKCVLFSLLRKNTTPVNDKRQKTLEFTSILLTNHYIMDKNINMPRITE